MRNKITVIGGGFVGEHVAVGCVQRELGDVILRASDSFFTLGQERSSLLIKGPSINGSLEVLFLLLQTPS